MADCFCSAIAADCKWLSNIKHPTQSLLILLLVAELISLVVRMTCRLIDPLYKLVNLLLEWVQFTSEVASAFNICLVLHHFRVVSAAIHCVVWSNFLVFNPPGVSTHKSLYCPNKNTKNDTADQLLGVSFPLVCYLVSYTIFPSALMEFTFT